MNKTMTKIRDTEAEKYAYSAAAKFSNEYRCHRLGFNAGFNYRDKLIDEVLTWCYDVLSGIDTTDVPKGKAIAMHLVRAEIHKLRCEE